MTLQLLNQLCRKKYTMNFNNSDNKFESIVYGLSNDVEILAKKNFNGISVFNIRKKTF